MSLHRLIEENKPLAPFTTLGIGGPARWFVSVTTEEEIAEAAAWSSERGVPLFVLGGGSNLVVSDGGFDGLVMRVGLRGISTCDDNSVEGHEQSVISNAGPLRQAQGRLSTSVAAAASAPHDQDCFGFEVSHPSDKNIDVARAGHPEVGDPKMRVAIANRGAQDDGIYQGSTQRIFRVAAGEDWDSFVSRSVEEGCAGIECLAGIPGTVGGTPVQNVGAYGQEVASTIVQVRAFDLRDQGWVEFTAAECGFAYRRSRFNTVDRGRYVVTRVDFQLTPGGTPTLRYADVQSAVGSSAEPSLAQIAEAVRRIRQSKGMLLVEGDPDCRSVGSFFKNPIVTKEQADGIEERWGKELPRFSAGIGEGDEQMIKIPAAWLIEQSGFAKGYALGAAGISSRHTLALINRGGATAGEILALAEAIKSAVQARFGIELEREPVLVGF